MITIVDLVWSTPARKWITSTAGAISAVAIAITSVPPAWSRLGFPHPASTEYVDSVVDPIKTAQNQTAQSVDRLTLVILQQNLAAAKADPALPASPTIQQRVRDLEQQINEVVRRLRMVR